MRLSRSSFYYQSKDKEAAKKAEADLRDRIEAICLGFPRYGYRRVTWQLRREGRQINHKKVLRLMRESDLLCRVKRKWVKTTDSKHPFRRYPNLIKGMVISRPTIYKWVDKALAVGIEEGLKDKYHRPKEPVITEEAKVWVINLACQKPTEYGYAAEMWTRSALASHARKYGPEAGHDCLKKAAKATIQRILAGHPLRPHKMACYLEKRDPEFEQQMVDVLCVYKEVNLQNGVGETEGAPPVITVSVDEKPGVPAIKNIAPDIMPEPGKQSLVLRDYEYERLGTLSILAALDLHDGQVTAQVHDRHRSREFISLLKDLDAYYPAESTIRIILDNHSAHISKETMQYLAGRPGRFLYVHTPTYGFWLNLVETLCGKMARTFLRHIRVNSKQELKERILLGVKEINDSPVVHRWKKFDFAHAF